MSEYDVTLKRILTRPGSSLLKVLTGYSHLKWLNIELPDVSTLRADLLGEDPDGDLIHIELQSSNDVDFPWRMGEYLFAIRKKLRRVPRQIALYVGERQLRMPKSIRIRKLTYEFDLFDIRHLDGEPLLSSPELSDNVIAVLTRLGSKPGTLRQILKRIADSPPAVRETAMAELGILASLRKLDDELEKGKQKMPITLDIMENKFIRRYIDKGLEQGMQQGMQQGIQQGMEQGMQRGLTAGQRELVLSLLEQRFGPASDQIRARLETMTSNELKAAGLRILTAQRPEDLFESN